MIYDTSFVYCPFVLCLLFFFCDDLLYQLEQIRK